MKRVLALLMFIDQTHINEPIPPRAALDHRDVRAARHRGAVLGSGCCCCCSNKMAVRGAGGAAAERRAS